MDQIFISYSRKDEAFARKLAGWLDKTLNVGIRISLDDISAGTKWSSAIQEGLDTCQVMVVIITPDSMESVNVEDEWQYFLDQDKPVVPILLKNAEIPCQLRRIQSIDFRVRQQYPNALRQLLTELRLHLKPLPGEEETLSRRSSHHPKSLTTKSLSDTQEIQTVQRGRRLRIILAMFTLVLIVGCIGAAVFLLSKSVSIQIVVVQGGGNSQVILPGKTEPVAAASIDSIPEGSRIISNEDVVRVESPDSNAAVVIEPNSHAAVTALSEEVQIQLDSGGVSIDTGDLKGGTVTTPYGISISVNGQTLGVGIDPASSTVDTSCYSGQCAISDEQGKTRAINSGEQLTFGGQAGNFDQADVTAISGSILFVSLRNGNAEIYAMNTDGSNQINLTRNPNNDRSPAWSPDGRWIAFVSDRRGSPDIFIMKPDGANVIQLTENPAADYDPAWSPDGKHIAFVSERDGNSELYLMNADGSNLIRLADHGDDSDPAWSPDGRQIAFTSSREDNREIYVMDIQIKGDGTVTTGAPVNLTNTITNDWEPAWSPDGRRIAFTSMRDGNIRQIFVMNADGSEPVNLTHTSTFEFDPAWSPDGRQIVFTSERLGSPEVFVVRLDDLANPMNLSNLLRPSDEEPAWLPFIRAGQGDD